MQCYTLDYMGWDCVRAVVQSSLCMLNEIPSPAFAEEYHLSFQQNREHVEGFSCVL